MVPWLCVVRLPTNYATSPSPSLCISSSGMHVTGNSMRLDALGVVVPTTASASSAPSDDKTAEVLVGGLREGSTSPTEFDAAYVEDSGLGPGVDAGAGECMGLCVHVRVIYSGVHEHRGCAPRWKLRIRDVCLNLLMNRYRALHYSTPIAHLSSNFVLLLLR